MCNQEIKSKAIPFPVFPSLKEPVDLPTAFSEIQYSARLQKITKNLQRSYPSSYMGDDVGLEANDLQIIRQAYAESILSRSFRPNKKYTEAFDFDSGLRTENGRAIFFSVMLCQEPAVHFGIVYAGVYYPDTSEKLDLTSFSQVFVSAPTLALLPSKIEKSDTATALEQLRDSFERSLMNRDQIQWMERGCVVHLDCRSPEHQPLSVILEPSQKGGLQPWYLKRIIESDCSTQLFRFASCPFFAEHIEKLAKLALPESWGEENGAESLSSLKMHIIHSFYHNFCHDQIEVNATGTFAAFHTGLLSVGYENIYAVFTRENTNQQWVLQGFATNAAGYFGKRLTESFAKLPLPASHCIKEFCFDANVSELILNLHHIVVDHVERIPNELLTQTLSAMPEFTPYLGSTPDYAALRELLERSTGGYHALAARITFAAKNAVSLARVHPRLAIPIYFASSNTQQLALPLDFSGEGTATLALVLVKDPHGVGYNGCTILPLSAARKNARIYGKPSDWLA